MQYLGCMRFAPDRLPPGDADFDSRFGTDTAGEIPAEMLAHAPEVATQSVSYEASDPGAFRHMIRELPIRYEDYAFVDLGSGKGRTLLLATSWPWRRIVGVEASPLLHGTARENLRAWARAGHDVRRIDLVHADVGGAEMPAGPLVLYLFNPFRERTMGHLLLNLKHSLQRQHRDVWIVYYNPQLAYMFEATGWLSRVCAGAGYNQGDYSTWRVHGDLSASF